MDYKKLLKISRDTIEKKLLGKDLEVDDSIKNIYSDKGACFVTLKKDGELRGCIGSLKAKKPLWKDVVENSINAAFNDFRFDPLNENELNNIDIELSILTPMEKIYFESNEELKEKIKNKGVYLSCKISSATFLPQVWEQLSDEEEFLGHLCMKAGFQNDAWKYNNFDFFIYDVIKIDEN
ncbi:MAG: AmmeMemoRadiSam system protein A [Nanobdellota archaeon]